MVVLSLASSTALAGKPLLCRFRGPGPVDSECPPMLRWRKYIFGPPRGFYGFKGHTFTIWEGYLCKSELGSEWGGVVGSVKGPENFPVFLEEDEGGARVLNVNTGRVWLSGINSSLCHHQENWYIWRAILDLFWSGKHSVYVTTLSACSWSFRVSGLELDLHLIQLQAWKIQRSNMRPSPGTRTFKEPLFSNYFVGTETL